MVESTTASGTGIAGPFLLNLDKEAWDAHLDAASTWLANVITAQVAYREMLESTVGKIREPNIRLYLEEMLETARRHEAVAQELPGTIGRDAADSSRGLAGTLVAAARKTLGQVEGMAGGASGNWKDLRELLIANLDAMGAFAVAEQLGLALANSRLRDLAFQVTAEKSSDQLVLQELMLEMASVSILYGEQV